jgi:hypothetical protein
VAHGAQLDGAGVRCRQAAELRDDLSFSTVNVTVATDPGRMVDEADDFQTVTGLPASCADLLVFGALGRLILGIEAARQQVTSVEAQNRADKTQPGSATTVARYWQALYQARLETERDRLQQSYPLQLLRRG